MFEKSLGEKIDEMIKAGKVPSVVLPMMGKAVKLYGEKLNDAFAKINAADVPYMIAALDTYKKDLINSWDPSGEGHLEESVRLMEMLMEPTSHAMRTDAHMTEPTARELVGAMRDRDE